MAAADDVADLLGNNELPVLHRPPPSSGFTWFQSILILFISLGLVTILAWCFTDNRSYYMRWREEKYRKRVRRKYGIPDSDHDVFNVAYANAKRREEEAMGLRRAQATVNSPAVGAGPSSTGLRLRGVAGAQNVNGVAFPAESSGHSDRRDQIRAERVPMSPIKPRTTLTPRSKPLDLEGEDGEVHHLVPKQSPEKRAAGGEHKRSRIESEDEGELMNVDPDVLGEMSNPRSKRGSKRHAGTDEDATPEAVRKKAGKRPRRISRRTQDLLLDLEEQEHGDKLMELDDALSRGKKRDRAEAGSTFGGDDDSPTTRGRKTRRKRRSTANAEAATEAELRGTKRVHDVESTLDSDEDDRVSRAKSIRKRGKHFIADGDSSTDMSLDGPAVRIEPSCAGHKVGDEWVVNGQLFKVGPDGKRLRQVLVKKRRSRYSMPTDSQHPDSQAQMVVLMETWLNDEEFQAAEERGDVFSTKKPDEEAEVEPPVKTGKTLLWTSTKNNISPKKAFKDSIIANVGTTNPFERPSYSSYGRRVSTGHDAFKQSSQSPVLTPSKSYSKWEKQDLEAEAMAKLRKKLEEQKKVSLAASESKKKVTFELPTSVSAPAMASSITAPAGLGTSTPTATTTSTTTAKPVGNLFGDPSKSTQPVNSSATAPSLSTPSATTGMFTPPVNKPASSSTDSVTQKPPVPLFFGPSAGKEKGQEKAKEAPSISFAPTPASAPAEPSKPAAPSFSFGQPSNPTPSVSAPTPIMFGEKKVDNAQTAPSSGSSHIFAPKPSLPSTSPSAAPMFSIKGAAQADNSQATTFNSTPSNPFAPSTPAAPPSTSGGFSFGAKPVSSTPTSTPTGFSFMNQPKPTTPATEPPKVISTTPVGTPSTSTASATPKFSFGFSKPDSASTPSFTTTPSEPPKPVTPTFGFGATSNNSTTPVAPAPKITFPSSPFGNSTAPAPAASASKPGFGFTTAGNSMTSTPAAPATNNNTSNSATTPKFSFSFGGAGGGNGAAGPSNTAAPANSGFGAAPKPATTTPSIFGNTNSKPADVPKPLFGFGSGGAPTPTTPGASNPTSEKSDKPAFSFNFGATPSAPPSGTVSSAPSVANPFGIKPAGSSGFSFGAPSNGAPTPSIFGKPADSASATTNIFGGSIGGSVFGNSQQKSS
ncbi:hypothetical protein SCHPADRAFT_1001614 [Schizopora paradoxa]|uniref:Uncharacterized protein n=1 Tax=Schizopora paradoxa TaxID=27342 RepID=A0A0H2R6S3_9AGAM|nr:hypothetical protein SCHPADRAFT_1001614 [Schizopora paradoxa]